MNEKKHITISVINITLNRAEWLKQTLNSLVKQARPADEVIVVDNGSTDHTKSIVDSFVEKLNIRYVYEEKRGIPNARNTGILNAKKDIIAFIDDDCVADKNWLKFIELAFLKDPHIGVVGGEVKYLTSSDAIVDQFYGRNMLPFIHKKK